MKKAIKFCLGIFMIVMLFVFSDEAKKSVYDALCICGEIFIPSLFPFMATALFISKTGLPNALSRPLGKAGNALFGCDNALLILLGLTAGYPVGTKLMANMYDDGKISATDAEFYMTFLVGAGPSFIVTAVGGGVFHSTAIGVAIFAACILGGLLNSLLFRCLLSRSDKKTLIKHTVKTDTIECFVTSVSDTGMTMLELTGFVVIFNCIYNLVTRLIDFKGMSSYVAQIFEVTTGVIMSQNKSPAIIAAGVGFGGLSVLFQVLFAARKIPIRKGIIVLSRITHSIFSFLIAEFLVRVFPIAREVFWSSGVPRVHESYTVTMCATLMLLAAVLICNIQNRQITD